MATSSVLTNNPISTNTSLKSTAIAGGPSSISTSSLSSSSSSSSITTRKRTYETAVSIPAVTAIHIPNTDSLKNISPTRTTINASVAITKSNTRSNRQPQTDTTMKPNCLLSIKAEAAASKHCARTISESDAEDEMLGAASMVNDYAAGFDNGNSPIKKKYVPMPTVPAVLSQIESQMPSISSGTADIMTICKPAPFSSDEEAVLERERCDYTHKITYQMARSGQTKRRVRVYADGIYDLFHQGHARQLMQAKNIFPNVYLIVGVCNDELTHRMKGRTVMDDFERYEAVRHCRYVDEIVQDAPWSLNDDFITNNKIDFVAHDDIPYTGEGMDDIYAPLKEKGMFVATERTEGVSTSDIVARIVKDYDLYVRRNLARGYSAKDLNVSFLSEKKFRLQNKMDELKTRGRRELTKVKGDIITKWEEKSREFIDAFLLLFGRDRLNHLWNESKGKLIQALSPPGSPSGSVNGDFLDFEDDEDAADISEEYTDLPTETNIHMEHSQRERRSYYRRVVDNSLSLERAKDGIDTRSANDEEDEVVEFELRNN